MVLLLTIPSYTDHKNLTALPNYSKGPANLNRRLVRWAQLIQEFSFDAKFVPGKDNIGPDYLSREGCKQVLANQTSLPLEREKLYHQLIKESKNPLSCNILQAAFINESRCRSTINTTQLRRSTRQAVKRSIQEQKQGDEPLSLNEEVLAQRQLESDTHQHNQHANNH